MSNLNGSKAFSSFSVNDPEKAKEFYGKVLELTISESEDMPGLLHLELAGGNTILIYPKPNHIAATFTVLNFPVDNIKETVVALKNKGIGFERYPGMDIDENGINRGGGPLIAWFKDPAGNVLSIIED